jgi:hypothetical protein
MINAKASCDVSWDAFCHALKGMASEECGRLAWNNIGVWTEVHCRVGFETRHAKKSVSVLVSALSVQAIN